MDLSDSFEFSPSPLNTPLMKKRGLLHLRDMAAVIARPGEHKRDLAMRVRGLVQRGYLWPCGRDEDDARQALIFDGGATLAAAALLAANDFGLVGKEQMGRVGFVLRTWRGNTPPGPNAPPSPAAWMILEHLRDPAPRGFGVELHMARNPETVRLAPHAILRDGARGYVGDGLTIVPEGHEIVGSLLLPLDGHLARIVPALVARQRRRSMN